MRHAPTASTYLDDGCGSDGIGLARVDESLDASNAELVARVRANVGSQAVEESSTLLRTAVLDHTLQRTGEHRSIVAHNEQSSPPASSADAAVGSGGCKMNGGLHTRKKIMIRK